MGTQVVSSALDLQTVNKITNLAAGTADGDAVNFAQLKSSIEGLSWKDSVRVRTTGNVNLASPGATIDGITMAANDRFLADQQTTASQNGIYVWNGAATPATRALDMDTAAEVEQAVVGVEEGTSAGSTYRQTAVNVTLGTTNLAFTLFGTSAPAASESTAGIAELATQAETDTGTDDARIVTPLKLATWSGRKRKYTALFGDGSATSYVITHNLNMDETQNTVYEAGGSKREVMVELQHTGVNSVTVLPTPAPASNALRIVVLG